jgi:hypothetical protein
MGESEAFLVIPAFKVDTREGVTAALTELEDWALIVAGLALCGTDAQAVAAHISYDVASGVRMVKQYLETGEPSASHEDGDDQSREQLLRAVHDCIARGLNGHATHLDEAEVAKLLSCAIRSGASESGAVSA